MSFYAFYPPAGGGSSNASVGTNGQTAPTSSTEVAGINPSGNLQPLQTDAAGNLLTVTTPAAGSVQHVIVDSSALPTGASTSALQTSMGTTLTTIAGNQTNGTQVIQLPTGASTSSLQTTGNTSLATIATNTTGVATAANQATEITALNALNVGALVSTANSSTTPLGANAVFTGTAENISQYSEVRVYVFADQASATDGLAAQQSSDGTNWDSVDNYTISASTGKVYGFGVGASFFRLVYTNGAVAQGAFRLQTAFHKTRTKPSSQRPQDAISNENDTEEVMAFGMLYNGTSWDRQRGDTTNGAYVNVRNTVTTTSTNTDLTASGNITIVNSNPNTGVATAGSTVALALNGQNTISIQVTGTYTGALTPQVTVDGANWVATAGLLNVNTNAQSPTIPSASVGIYQLEISGMAQFRLTALAAVTGTAVITLRGSVAQSGVAIDAPIPAGANAIGTVTLGAGAAAIGSLGAGAAVIGQVKMAGKAVAAQPIRNDYTVTNVTTAAYVQLTASLSAACTEISIFDSSGQTLALATGASGSEVIQCYIFPGGQGTVPLAIASATRVAVKAISATAAVGELDINFFV